MKDSHKKKKGPLKRFFSKLIGKSNHEDEGTSSKAASNEEESLSHQQAMGGNMQLRSQTRSGSCGKCDNLQHTTSAAGANCLHANVNNSNTKMPVIKRALSPIDGFESMDPGEVQTTIYRSYRRRSRHSAPGIPARPLSTNAESAPLATLNVSSASSSSATPPLPPSKIPDFKLNVSTGQGSIKTQQSSMIAEIKDNPSKSKSRGSDLYLVKIQPDEIKRDSSKLKTCTDTNMGKATSEHRKPIKFNHTEKRKETAHTNNGGVELKKCPVPDQEQAKASESNSKRNFKKEVSTAKKDDKEDIKYEQETPLLKQNKTGTNVNAKGCALKETDSDPEPVRPKRQLPCVPKDVQPVLPKHSPQAKRPHSKKKKVPTATLR